MQLITPVGGLYSNVNQGIFQPNTAYTQQALNISRWKCSKTKRSRSEKNTLEFFDSYLSTKGKNRCV